MRRLYSLCLCKAQLPALPLPVAVAGALFSIAPASSANAQSAQGIAANSGTPIVAVVNVPAPWYAPRALIVSKMRDTISLYENLPGLSFKAFALRKQGNQFGGIYHWKNRQSADQWFTPEWFARIKRERGVDGNVRFFDAPVTLENAAYDIDAPKSSGFAPSEASLNGIGSPTPPVAQYASTPVATVVLITTPQGVTRQQLIAGFTAALPTERNISGLWRKHFIIADDGRFGGVYLWSNEAAASAWLSEAWQQQVKATYGTAADIEWYDVPILLPSKNPANRIDASQSK
jgi:hypothetical protein